MDVTRNATEWPNRVESCTTMQTSTDKQSIHTELSDDDRRALSGIIELLGPLVNLEPIARYATMSAEEVWSTLVIQVCVMGSARHIQRLTDDSGRYRDFQEAASLPVVSKERNRAAYLARVLREFRATRFHQKGADRLAAMLSSPRVFQGDKISLLDRLSHQEDGSQTRDELIRRCPAFGLKSASDFMITIGLSHDVIALDTRLIGIFQRHFGYKLDSGKVQSNRGIYFSLEAALRGFCREKQVSLALLDRLLFNFDNLSAVDLVLDYPQLTDRLRQNGDDHPEKPG